MFVFMFLVTGVGNASTFQMIPNIMRREVPRLMPELAAADVRYCRPYRPRPVRAFAVAVDGRGAIFRIGFRQEQAEAAGCDLRGASPRTGRGRGEARTPATRQAGGGTIFFGKICQRSIRQVARSG